MSRRKNLPFEIVAQLTDLDVKNFFEGKISGNELSEKRKLMLMVFEDGRKPAMYWGKEAGERIKSIKGKLDEATEVEGMCASVGTAVGKACVQLTPNIKTFKEGCVLVTTMTTPEFVPIMRKAIAIVTDEGGITCHAAIVSRELGIPCIVGTKTATKVFKDGDMVEVKANHGIARKL